MTRSGGVDIEERPVKRPHLCFWLLVFGAAGVASAADALDALEREMAKLVNADREKHKAAPLTYHPGLSRVARAHSLDMVHNGFFDHDSKRTGKPADRVAKAGIPHRGVGENLARGTTVRQAQTILMNSPKHRKNILSNDFTHVGVGIVKGRGGWLMVTQLFIRTVPVRDVAALPQEILKDVNALRRKGALRPLVKDDLLMRVAREHSERAARTGRPDPLWIEDRLALLGAARRWRIRSAEFVLTDDPKDALKSRLVASPLYRVIGIGVVQSTPKSKSAGALLITLICAKR